MNRSAVRRERGPTPEDKLWSFLEDRDVAGLRFRRREMVGPYLVEFLCPAARLIIDVSGEDDPERRGWLRTNGYRVLQFDPHDILNNPQLVLDSVGTAFQFRVIRSKP